MVWMKFGHRGNTELKFAKRWIEQCRLLKLIVERMQKYAKQMADGKFVFQWNNAALLWCKLEVDFLKAEKWNFLIDKYI